MFSKNFCTFVYCDIRSSDRRFCPPLLYSVSNLVFRSSLKEGTRRNTTRHNTILHKTQRNATRHHNTKQRNTTLYDSKRHNTITTQRKHYTIQCNTTQRNITQDRTMQSYKCPCSEPGSLRPRDHRNWMLWAVLHWRELHLPREVLSVCCMVYLVWLTMKQCIWICNNRCLCAQMSIKANEA